jgi:hypothetical protein
MTTEQNLKTLFAAFGYCVAAFAVMRVSSTHAWNYGPMITSTAVPFACSFLLAALGGFSLARCALAAAFTYLFLLYSIWWSGLAAVGVAPLILMPLFVFLGYFAGERYLRLKHRG